MGETLSERRYCQRKGCRERWVHDLIRKRTGAPRRYCKKCMHSMQRWRNEVASPEALQRRADRDRKYYADVLDKRVGLRVDRPLCPRVPCERCMRRPARKGFSFCMQCSACLSCGKNKPEIGVMLCRACKLSRKMNRDEWRKRPGVKEKIRSYSSAYDAAYYKRPGVRDRKIEYARKRYAADSRFRKKYLASRRKRKGIARLRVQAKLDKRVCAERDCTKRLVGKIASAIYCSGACGQRARRKDGGTL